MYRLTTSSVLVTFLLIMGSPVSTADEVGIRVVFTDDEISTIQGFYRRDDALSKYSKQKHKKHKGLPPGIAKNLQRGKALPPGIAKQHLPQDLQTTLPPVPNGYERVIIDGKILLIEIATQVVRDVLTDIVIG